MSTLTNKDISSRSRLAIAQDSFIRASTAGSTTIGAAAGWGTPSDNSVNSDTWAKAGSAQTYAINSSNQGTVTGVGGNSYQLLGSRTVTQGESLVRFSLTQQSDSAGFVFLYASTNNHYRIVCSSSTIKIVLSNGGVTSQLASTAATISGATLYWMKGKVVSSAGTNVFFGKVWASGTAEPSSWSVTATDTTFTAAGQIGFYTKPNLAANVITYDSFAFYDASAPNHDIAARLLLQAQPSRDIASRTRMQAVSSRDIQSRTILAVTRLRDLASRLRLQVVSLRDSKVRLLLQAQTSRDLASRLLLAAQLVRDISSRTRLQSQPLLRDIKSRFPLQSVSLRDVGARFRLQSQPLLRDLVSRTRLQALIVRDIQSRVRIQVQILRDVSSRFTLQGIAPRDISSRVKLSRLVLRDVSGRVRLQAIRLRDIGERLVLASLGLKDIGSRVRLSVLSSHDITMRFILALPPTPPPAPIFGYPDGIVLSPTRAQAGFAGVGTGPGVGQPTDTIGGHRN